MPLPQLLTLLYKLDQQVTRKVISEFYQNKVGESFKFSDLLKSLSNTLGLQVKDGYPNIIGKQLFLSFLTVFWKSLACISSLLRHGLLIRFLYQPCNLAHRTGHISIRKQLVHDNHATIAQWAHLTRQANFVVSRLVFFLPCMLQKVFNTLQACRESSGIENYSLFLNQRGVLSIRVLHSSYGEQLRAMTIASLD